MNELNNLKTSSMFCLFGFLTFAKESCQYYASFLFLIYEKQKKITIISLPHLAQHIYSWSGFFSLVELVIK
ncbi:hypothetical protein L6452_38390 [Arctium lappa]|uniref:Uncharacterized protein n=1 Tax=Arctium lappa TaxID=4217 RepID=A0ACB8Y5M2_ARCLA|nr:hypothetical protein L6452_38390 [Arctium lappa]